MPPEQDQTTVSATRPTGPANPSGDAGQAATVRDTIEIQERVAQPDAVPHATAGAGSDLTAHDTTVTPVSLPPQHPLGRIPVLNVRPTVDGNHFPVKSVVNENFWVHATVFREGHDAVNATVVIIDPDGNEYPQTMTCINVGLSEWRSPIAATGPGMWAYRVEGWSDPYATWRHAATVKIDAGVDVDLMLEEGAILLERAAATDDRTPEQAALLTAAAAVLRDTGLDVDERLDAGISDPVAGELWQRPLRDMVTPSEEVPWLVERELALRGSWYEIFPRSEGAHRGWNGAWQSGTLRTAAARLDGIRDMGFDVVYLTPIHPIGTTNRKGPNNTLDAGPGDPGSPYAIGSELGGHDAIHPDLGTFDDFDAFVARARDLGMEVALDLALQCSPDHPWVTEHPEWFTTRADGTIAYAENPPKKYQDIYPLNFDNDPAGIYHEVRRVVQVWIDHGVTLFRVDNPHTKPVEFWQWLIADVAADHPEIIWLSEAFTKPAMMHTLAKVGFQQSYTYFAWRNEKWELEEYCRELVDSAHYMRPSFWPTTHDILTPYMQHGGPAAWKVRAALAATLVPTYGIYAGYELMESVPRPGVEEQIDNEKYEFKDRQWCLYAPGGKREGESLHGWLKMLNTIRFDHPALGWLRNLVFHHVDDENVMCYSKERYGDTILVVANLDPHTDRESLVRLDMGALGFGHDERFLAHDLVTDEEWEWGAENFVRLGPSSEPVHIIHVKRYF
ncbi:alpha-1,4-glucan--maltose-1-phosphate maltosyltransferase [Kribbia dieselivorans]|uniref:alpha-1,4-glucan--maltose-1-phosphate maltosyltransferase n=1 Tax=Kribbia dieselivorans TaxID=331526 RepID=UPI00351E995D